MPGVRSSAAFASCAAYAAWARRADRTGREAKAFRTDGRGSDGGWELRQSPSRCQRGDRCRCRGVPVLPRSRATNGDAIAAAVGAPKGIHYCEATDGGVRNSSSWSVLDPYAHSRARASSRMSFGMRFSSRSNPTSDISIAVRLVDQDVHGLLDAQGSPAAGWATAAIGWGFKKIAMVARAKSPGEPAYRSILKSFSERSYRW
jgi:hypothetical protein